MGPVGESTIAEALQQRSLAPSSWVLGALVSLHAVGFVETSRVLVARVTEGSRVVAAYTVDNLVVSSSVGEAGTCCCEGEILPLLCTILCPVPSSSHYCP